MQTLLQLLADFGARAQDCVSLASPREYRLLRYVDLLDATLPPMVDTVVESRSQPLLYVVRADRLTDGPRQRTEIMMLRRNLAMRGDQAWIGIISPGRLDIYATDLFPDETVPPKTFIRHSPGAAGIVPRLASGEELVSSSGLQLRDELYRLMTHAGTELRELGVPAAEAIALTGRALFFRYLIDRGIIRSEHLPQISPSSATFEDCFGSVVSLTETSHWLDRTFNGDLLRLPNTHYLHYFGSLYARYGQHFIRPLSAILGLDSALAPGFSQRRLDWGDLRFNHIPVGLLSETYEELMQTFDAQARHRTSVYYTPSLIAEYMVSEALYDNPAGHRAKVLDPACGAGVFLVAAFRRLAEMHFEQSGQRPDRAVLRQILNTQLTGFDINSHAITLAALALYLTALELDPAPSPVEALRFNKLEGHVLINVADPGSGVNTIQPMTGSLGPHVSTHFRGMFDLVVGNPPWTSPGPGYRHIEQQFTDKCRQVARRRFEDTFLYSLSGKEMNTDLSALSDNIPDHMSGLYQAACSYANPDGVPDLPFLWGAMEWVKPGGRIALALAARWLFKMSAAGFAARRAVFSSLAVTGILNGVSIRTSNVWPNITAPFSLVFADNRLPGTEDRFVFVSPEDEPDLNRKGRIRIDPADTETVSLRLAAEEPYLLKALYRGGYMGYSIIQRILRADTLTIGEYWSRTGLSHQQGYKVSNRRNDDQFLAGMPDLKSRYDLHPFAVMPEALPQYVPGGLERPREPAVYRAPLVLVRKGNRADRSRGRALISDCNVAFCESYFGYSTAGADDPFFLSRYLLVLIHSQVFEFFTLMTSGEFGYEREALQALDINAFPLVSPDSLDEELKTVILQVAEEMEYSRAIPRSLDQAVLKVYGLGEQDARIIQDVLETRSPFPTARQRASGRVTREEENTFHRYLSTGLNNVLRRTSGEAEVRPLENIPGTPWRFMAITPIGQDIPSSPPQTWMSYADDNGVSRVILADIQNKHIVVGLYDRYRYWTPTQARLLASDIIWQYGAMLEDIMLTDKMG